MDKSSKLDIPIDEQRKAWNTWNAQYREKSQGEKSRRQSVAVDRWMDHLPKGLSILEIGCGSGWMCERLTKFGKVTGIDLADEVIQCARLRLPNVEFVSGDFLSIDFPKHFDVAVGLEVLSHVQNQPAFIARVAALLNPGGYLMLATQNKPVLERASAVGGPIPGHIRHWVDAKGLRQLLTPHFKLIELTSILPEGNQGYLRIVNSPKLNAVLATVVPGRLLERTKERLLFGQTLIVLARKSATSA